MAIRQPVIYLTAGEVITFNQEILRRAEQPFAVLRERALLDGAIQRPQNAAYYTGADLITHAAVYMVGIALNRPFVDGNKRTGYIAGMTFLRVNGYLDMGVSLDDDQIAIWLEQVVTRAISLDTCTESLRRRLEGARAPNDSGV
jgi:death on curing protein